MQTRVEHFELGKITWRTPNSIEKIRLLGRLGLQANGKLKDDNEYVLTANLMEAIAPLIVSIDAQKDGEAITEWDRALEIDEFAVPIQKIAFEVFNILTGAGAKKKESQDGETNSPDSSHEKKES